MPSFMRTVTIGTRGPQEGSTQADLSVIIITSLEWPELGPTSATCVQHMTKMRSRWWLMWWVWSDPVQVWAQIPVVMTWHGDTGEVTPDCHDRAYLRHPPSAPAWPGVSHWTLRWHLWQSDSQNTAPLSRPIVSDPWHVISNWETSLELGTVKALNIK